MRISEAWLSLAAMSGLTILLRAIPLLLRKSLLRTSWMLRLNEELPLCVMVVLVAHSLSTQGSSGSLLAEMTALAAVAASYLRWRNALVSVMVGLTGLALLTRLW